VNTPRVDLVLLTVDALTALLAGDLDGAGRQLGLDLPPFFLAEGWLWQIRLDQQIADPASAPWLVRAAVGENGTVVGHAGFHGPPVGGMVEVGYTVVPDLRGQGIGHALLAALLREAASQPEVQTVRASVSPENAPSLAVVARAGFVRTGEQWDDEDGLELIFERPAR